MSAQSCTGFRRVVDIVLRLLLATVFAWSAFHKARLGRMGTNTIYGLVIQRSSTAHYAFIAVEGTLALLLAVGLFRRWTSLACIIMLSMFAAVIAAELTRDRPRPCGCLSVPDFADSSAVRRELTFALGRNGALVMAAASIYLRSRSLSNTHHRRSSRAAPDKELSGPIRGRC